MFCLLFDILGRLLFSKHSFCSNVPAKLRLWLWGFQLALKAASAEDIRVSAVKTWQHVSSFTLLRPEVCAAADLCSCCRRGENVFLWFHINAAAPNGTRILRFWIFFRLSRSWWVWSTSVSVSGEQALVLGISPAWELLTGWVLW